ncbi:unnamed protein product [Heligmosomoides polygyrus]|uniref:Transcriptional regulator n=1 Tax=Heligmosomoides polygyrus TaxID=6339 RepID=A0A183FUC0_HELPZ|nr:unnamed protein product [Heligmosomoides polygyrus]
MCGSRKGCDKAGGQQMNVHEFENVECHASFDPIAAAQDGYLRDDVKSTNAGADRKARFQPERVSSPKPTRDALQPPFRRRVD